MRQLNLNQQNQATQEGQRKEAKHHLQVLRALEEIHWLHQESLVIWTETK
jgi:hypothetical protein